MMEVIGAPTAPTEDGGDYVRITPLGAGSEVGRSCHIVEYKGKTVMLDCGIHPGGVGIAALPYLDEIDPAKIDLLLVSHFHLDHAAALPYFLEKTDFNGRVFMTHPTKSIYKLILLDYVKVSTVSIEETLYDETDLMNSMDKIECINFHQVIHHKGIKFWCYNAGHVLGAAMFMLEIDGVKILYTGDYSRREDRHLMAAEIPDVKPDILIVEATYGTQTLQPVKDREKRFTEVIHQIIKRGGRVLLPVFALGRAQELLLILEEYWEANPGLQDYPIYYASSLAKKCMLVYQTYIHMMNKRIQKQFEVSNPFIFKHVSNLRGMDKFDDVGPSVVMASPGMLQNGLSRELFELWCTDPKNGCVVAGYCVKGTLANAIMAEPKTITALSGLELPLNMSIHFISFSAHADYAETSAFIDELRPSNVVLVHGEANSMGRLKQALMRTYDDGSMTVSTPKNCQTVEIEFRSQKEAKIVGRLAGTTSEFDLMEGEETLGKENAESSAIPEFISGVVVRKDFTDRIMAPEDLPLYTPLSSTTVTQSLKVAFHHTFESLKSFLSRIYDLVEDTEDITEAADIEAEKDQQRVLVPVLRIMDCVDLMYKVNGNHQTDHILMEWSADPVSDMVTDSIVCLLTSIQSSPATAKEYMEPCSHGKHKREEEEAATTKRAKVDPQSIASFFVHHFGSKNVKLSRDELSLHVSHDDESVTINLVTGAVDGSEELQTRAHDIFKWSSAAQMPCGAPFDNTGSR